MPDKIILDYENKEVRGYLNGAIHFYGITKDVGWGCPNKRADVMLVQYMLSTAWSEDVLVCDGVFGPKTAAWIREMQSAYKNVKIDGKINAIDGTKLRSTVSNTIYTVLAMNAEFIKYMPSLYMNIKEDERMPAELRSNLFIKSGSGYGSLKGQPQTMVN